MFPTASVGALAFERRNAMAHWRSKFSYLKEIINRAAFKDFENLSNVTELRKQLFEKLL